MRLRATRLTAIATAVRRAFPVFSPSELFATGAPGLWYDLSLTDGTLFQDAAGRIPAALEQPVGLVLDKSKGLVLGPEMITSPYAFSGGTLTGWSTTGSAIIHTGATGNATLAGTASVAGKTYKVSFTVSGMTGVAGGGGFFNYGGAPLAATSAFYTDGKYSFVVTAVNTGGLFFAGYQGTPWEATISNISVRELPGNHAFQVTSASRPVLSARKNKLLATAALATQNVTVRAVGHVLSFWGTGTITLSGASTAGPLVGTGAGNRVYLEFTPTAGTLTLTVSGSVLKAQLEEINETV